MMYQLKMYPIIAGRVDVPDDAIGVTIREGACSLPYVECLVPVEEEKKPSTQLVPLWCYQCQDFTTHQRGPAFPLSRNEEWRQSWDECLTCGHCA